MNTHMIVLLLVITIVSELVQRVERWSLFKLHKFECASHKINFESDKIMLDGKSTFYTIRTRSYMILLVVCLHLKLHECK